MKALTIALCFALCISMASAYSSYMKRIPNGNNVTRRGTHWPAVSHVTPTGRTPLDAFGVAFKAANKSWTTELCQNDTDGDGYTNGVELGDPDCTWTPGATLSKYTGISHPAFADSTPLTEAVTPGPATTTAGSYSLPEGFGTFTWSMNCPANDKLSGSFNNVPGLTGSDWYVAVGFGALPLTEKMANTTNIACCFTDTSVDCALFQCHNLPRKSCEKQPVSDLVMGGFTLNSNSKSVSFSVPITSALRLGDSNTSIRMIMGHGPCTMAGNQVESIGRHTHDGRSSHAVNMYTGTCASAAPSVSVVLSLVLGVLLALLA